MIAPGSPDATSHTTTRTGTPSMPELPVHAGRHYAVQHHYALSDDAWCLELREAVPMPDKPLGPVAYRAGRAFLTAYIPDEDPDLEPTIHVHSHDEHVIPYDIMRWFMEQVAEQLERCRTAFSLGEMITMWLVWSRRRGHLGCHFACRVVPCRAAPPRRVAAALFRPAAACPAVVRPPAVPPACCSSRTNSLRCCCLGCCLAAVSPQSVRPAAAVLPSRSRAPSPGRRPARVSVVGWPRVGLPAAGVLASGSPAPAAAVRHVPPALGRPGDHRRPCRASSHRRCPAAGVALECRAGCQGRCWRAASSKGLSVSDFLSSTARN